MIKLMNKRCFPLNKYLHYTIKYCSISPEQKRHLHAEKRSPTLIVNPGVFLHDVIPNIRVEGLEPQTSVTLKAQMVEDKGKLLYSHAHFVADQDGVVDVSVSSSVNGSYKGVFPSGLLSTLKISSGHFAFGSIRKNDIYKPTKIKISALEGHTSIEDNEPELQSVEVEQLMISKGVQRIPVKVGRVRGVLYIPEGEGPFPGVIDMFGATGVLYETRSALNASRGIASLSLAYFRYDDIPIEKIYDLDLEYFEEATEYLLSHPKVKSESCGVVGNCAGGLIAYNMGLHIEKVKATFIINSYINLVLGHLKYKGKNIAENPLSEKDDGFQIDADGTHIPNDIYIEAIADLSESQIADFHKTTDDKNFAIAIGEYDSFNLLRGWKKFESNLNDKKKQRFTLRSYPEAGHILNPPYSPFTSIAYFQLPSSAPRYENGCLLNFGGVNKGTVNMQEKVWEWMFQFFQTHLGN